MREMLPRSWVSPCNRHCTRKFAAFTQIPWRIYCKKGCSSDADTWEECADGCDKLCYKDPVYKDQQWSVILDRSPGLPSSSQKCFYACISGCGNKFDVPTEVVEGVHVLPNRPKSQPPPQKPALNKVAVAEPQIHTVEEDDLAHTSA